MSPELPPLPGTSPSPELRARILQSAREAPRSATTRHRRVRGWTRPAAALLLFAVGGLAMLWPVGESEQELSSDFVARAKAWTEALVEAAAKAAGRRF